MAGLPQQFLASDYGTQTGGFFKQAEPTRTFPLGNEVFNNMVTENVTNMMNQSSPAAPHLPSAPPATAAPPVPQQSQPKATAPPSNQWYVDTSGFGGGVSAIAGPPQGATGSYTAMPTNSGFNFSGGGYVNSNPLSGGVFGGG